MSDIKVVRIHADQRAETTVTTGTKAWELFRDDTDVVAARVAGQLKDLAYELADGDEVEAVAIDSADGRDILRHSTAHVLAQAVQQIWPEAKLGIGPPIENGFYYDFDVETPFVPEDLVKIESAMRKIIKENQRFERRVTTDADALDELKDEPYKIELIGLKGGAGAADTEGASVEVGAGELTIYDNIGRSGEAKWSDLCRGPHLPTTKRIPAFKLMRSAAAYWRGDEKNKQLQRIYGTAWESKEALEAHLERIDEAERRDHRKLGRDLDLSRFPDEIGSGLRGLPPQGWRHQARDGGLRPPRHIEEGFDYVGTPHISKEGLFHTSGHLPYYKDTMFPPMEFEGVGLLPQGDELPDAQPDLPLARSVLPRAAAAVLRVRAVYRYEKSGVVHGLTRVRGMTQDDSHSYVTPEQAPAEVKHLLDFVTRTAARLRPRRLLPRAVDPRRLQARQVRRLGRAVGDRHRGARDRRAEFGARPRARPGRCRVLRTEDLGAGQGRDRAHVADVDHPVRLQPAAATASTSSTSPPTAAGSSR